MLLGGVSVVTGLAHLLENDAAEAASAWARARALLASEQLHGIVAEIDAELERLQHPASKERVDPSQDLIAVIRRTPVRGVVGSEFQFTATQAACVEILWGAWEKGSPDVVRSAFSRDVDSGLCGCSMSSAVRGLGDDDRPRSTRAHGLQHPPRLGGC